MKYLLLIISVVMFITGIFSHDYLDRVDVSLTGFILWTGYVVIIEIQKAIRENKCTHSSK